MSRTFLTLWKQPTRMKSFLHMIPTYRLLFWELFYRYVREGSEGGRGVYQHTEEYFVWSVCPGGKMRMILICICVPTFLEGPAWEWLYNMPPDPLIWPGLHDLDRPPTTLCPQHLRALEHRIVSQEMIRTYNIQSMRTKKYPGQCCTGAECWITGF